MKAGDARQALSDLADPGTAAVLQGFFKTGPGEYGEGDVFLGVKVPDCRGVARQFGSLPLRGVGSLLRSAIHEERLLALLLLVQRFKTGNEVERERVYRFYLNHTGRVNNWDLVDLSAPHIAGAYLYGRDRGPLYELAVSPILWERRIAIVATAFFIRRADPRDTFRIAELLLADTEDLIHKAAGWMLREAGKVDQAAEEKFLRKHARGMPRTMLRYAIERFPESKRRMFLRADFPVVSDQ